MMNYRLYSRYLVEVLKAALTGQKLELRKDIEPEMLIKLAVAHGVENVLYTVFSDSDISDEVKQNMKKLQNICISRLLMQQYEQDALFDRLETDGIEHMVLKGSVIRKEYPQEYLRQSCDIDVYVSDGDKNRINAIMTGMGYEIIDCTSPLHYEYRKKSVINVEIHHKLMTDRHHWYGICMDIEKNLRPVSGKKYEMQMPDEDFYIYMIAHIAKHIVNQAGIGIRPICDIWVFLQNPGRKLDRKYIDNQLEKGGLMTLEKKLRKLSEIWFGNAEDSPGTEAELEQFVLCSGMTGTEDLRNSYDKVKMSGGKYRKAVAIKYIHLFFRPMSKMKRDYPILNKLPFLYPLMLICWHTGNCIHRRELIAEVISKNKQNKDKEEKINAINRLLGL